MPDRTARILAVSAGMALAALGAGAGAAAAKPNEAVDPDSPAGKEYALPFDSARRDAAGGGISGGGGDSSPPAFGAGITPRTGSQPDGGGPEDNGSSPDVTPSERGGGGGSTAVGGPKARAAVAKAIAENSGGLSAELLSGLVALGVLLVGGMIGLAVRALQRPRQAT